MSNSSYQSEALQSSLNHYLEQEGLVQECQAHYGLQSFLQNRMLLIESIRKGVSYALFQQLQSFSPFNEAEWAEYLNISQKTLQRNSKTEAFHFKPIHSEKIFELAEVSNLGSSVFDSPDAFRLWLNSPSPALGNHLPKQLIQNSYGKELVIDELHRINHGVFA